MNHEITVSLVIPVFNEKDSIQNLVTTIRNQTCLPAEVILVDGGSTDNTVQLIEQLIFNDSLFRVIKAGRAMPGKGRNIGAGNAIGEWIAFTDAGIYLDKYWLEKMVQKAKENPEAAIIYGNFSPQLNSFFDRGASIAYVPAMQPNSIRTKSIATCLLKKEVWEKAGGFPDWRATEDLVFMERAEQLGYKTAFAKDAMVYWQLRPDLKSTYKKFVLYSMHNVWAGRQAHWHYGIAKQYAVMLLFVLLAIFHSWYWLLLIPVWLSARVLKRMLAYRYEFGIKSLLNPALFFLTMVITLTIDAATFSGWLSAVLRNKEQK